MFAREQFGLRGDLQSDATSVYPLTSALLALPGLRFMRDPTRGGLAMIANEICRATGRGVRLRGAAIPVRDPVASVCEMLGYDPLYLACEGRVVAVVAPDDADAALATWHALPQGRDAALIGYIADGNGGRAARPDSRTGGGRAKQDAAAEEWRDSGFANHQPHVVLETELGGERLLEELEDDPLPRIC
jgi:hydrogenase expression/formation protein HypE